MKKTLIFSILMLIFSIGFSACKATPLTPQVVSKAVEIDYAALETSVNQLDTLPEHYSEDYDTQYKNLKIRFDASVQIPVNAYCSVDRIEKMKLSDDQIDLMVRALANDREVFFEPTEKTSEQLEREILYYKEMLLKSRDEALKGKIVDIIQEIENELASAPSDTKLKKYAISEAPMNSEFRCISFPSDSQDAFTTSIMFITRGGDSFCYYFRNDMVLQTASMVAAGDAIAGEAVGTTIPDPHLSDKDAILVADQFLATCGIRDLVYTNAEKARVILNHSNENKYGWNLVYLRDCGGLLAIDTGRSYSFNQDQLPDHVAPWDSERMEFFITEDGIDGFIWSGASNTIDEVAKNVDILPFEDAMLYIGRNIKYKSLWPGKEKTNTKADILVDKIVLGNCAIEVKNHADQGYVIPVWYAHYLNHELGPDYEAWLAISAIDGSYIEPMMSADILASLQG